MPGKYTNIPGKISQNIGWKERSLKQPCPSPRKTAVVNQHSVGQIASQFAWVLQHFVTELNQKKHQMRQVGIYQIPDWRSSPLKYNSGVSLSNAKRKYTSPMPCIQASVLALNHFLDLLLFLHTERNTHMHMFPHAFFLQKPHLNWDFMWTYTMRVRWNRSSQVERTASASRKRALFTLSQLCFQRLFVHKWHRCWWKSGVQHWKQHLAQWA